jgi:hypothetical protein
MKRPSFTVLVECKNKSDCKMAIKDLEKKRGKYIRAIHETIPWKMEDISKLGKATNIRLGKADFIIEVAASKYNELEDVKRDFRSHLPPAIASLSIE